MTAVGLVVHGGRPSAVRTARGLIRWLAGREVDVRLLDEDPQHSTPIGRGTAELAAEAGVRLVPPT
jgi:hypothetical protein